MNKNNTESPSKWVIKEGGCVDTILFTNGKKDITFDEWFKIEYTNKK